MWPLRLQCSPTPASALTSLCYGTDPAYQYRVLWLSDFYKTQSKHIYSIRQAHNHIGPLGQVQRKVKGRGIFHNPRVPGLTLTAPPGHSRDAATPNTLSLEVKQRAPSCWDRSDHCVWCSLLPKLLDKGNLISVPDAITEKDRKVTVSELQTAHPGLVGIRNNQVRMLLIGHTLLPPHLHAGCCENSRAVSLPCSSWVAQGDAHRTVNPARDPLTTAIWWAQGIADGPETYRLTL